MCRRYRYCETTFYCGLTIDSFGVDLTPSTCLFYCKVNPITESIFFYYQRVYVIVFRIIITHQKSLYNNL
jgi:hypothetical protein